MNVFDVLIKRGFIDQTTNDEELASILGSRRVTCYIGFDPTASSLHVGSLIPIMALAHMQRSGHRPIALVGGGTGLIGDPSGKTEMRQLLTEEMINRNSDGIKAQLSRFLDFSDDGALLLNNADWLRDIKYIPFLRDIGRHFSVNRMIKAESYRMRLESEEGLNFIEFNYMLLQAYDFLELFDQYGCILQMGGSDQWGNIVAGIELIRRVKRENAYGITFPLITTSSGAKMGKTAKGAVWLDAERTSPYEYYQYWINTDDADVVRFLRLFTFLPMDEIEQAQKLEGSELNAVKSILAFETTRLVHGYDAALSAHRAAGAVFGARNIPDSLIPSCRVPRESGVDGDSVPTYIVSRELIEEGLPVYRLFAESGLVRSKGEARRLIRQNGAYLNGERISDENRMVTATDLKDDQLLLRAGKKRFMKVKFPVDKNQGMG